MNFDFSCCIKCSVHPGTLQKMQRSFFKHGTKHRNALKSAAFKPFLVIAGLQKMQTLLIYHGFKGIL